jgi:hypothetical protein
LDPGRLRIVQVDEIGRKEYNPGEADVSAPVRLLSGEATAANPIYEKKLGRDEAQARATHTSENGQTVFIGYRKPNGEIVYAEPPREVYHTHLAGALGQHAWDRVAEGWIQFRVFPDDGVLGMRGASTPVGHKRMVKLAKHLQEGNPPFRLVEVELEFLEGDELYRFVEFQGISELERGMQAGREGNPITSKGNPGIVQRFAGGVLGKAKWILPFPEYADKVQAELERRGLHPKGRPLESRVMDVLRVVYDEAVEEYRRGGPGAVDEWAKGYQGRKSNPELQEWMWAVQGRKILFSAPLEGPHAPDYENHAEWLGLPDVSDRQKSSYGRVLAYRQYGEVELYIGSYASDAPKFPIDRVKAEFKRTHPRYANYPWSDDSAKNPRCGNPLDIATVLGVGVIAGAVQGVVEPYVTKHVYGTGSGPAVGVSHNPSGMTPDEVVDHAQDIIAASGDDMEYFVFRSLHEDEKPKVGSTMRPSREWEDGSVVYSGRSQVKLPGTAGFYIHSNRYSDVRAALDEALKYYQGFSVKVALLGGTNISGADMPEHLAVALKHAKVLAVYMAVVGRENPVTGLCTTRHIYSAPNGEVTHAA